MVLLIAVLGSGGAAADGATACTNGVDWSLLPNKPSSPPTFLGDATKVFAPVGTAASVLIKSVAPHSCEFDVYFSSGEEDKAYEFADAPPDANGELSADVPMDGLHVTICYQKCSDQLSEWFYFFEPELGSSGAAPANQTMGGGTGCDCSHLPSSNLAVNPSRVAGEPVNTDTGAFVSAATDLRMGGSGFTFSADRTYNSDDRANGPFGPGWSSLLGVSLSVAGSGVVTFRSADGQRLAFKPLPPSGLYTRAPGARASLVKTASGYTLTEDDRTAWSFDRTGRVLRAVDRSGHGLAFHYGKAGLASVTDAAGRAVSVTTVQGRITKLALPDGRSVTYGYAAGRLATVRDAAGGVTTYSYSAAGYLTKIVDPLRHATIANTYDASGRVTSQKDALGRTTRFAWDQATGTCVITDPAGHKQTDVYAGNVLVRHVDANGGVTTYSYDANLDLIGSTDPLGRTTTLAQFDDRGDPGQVTDPRGLSAFYTYDSFGDVLTVTDPSGDQVFTYDHAGNLLTAQDQNLHTTTFTYDSQGRLATVTDPDGHRWTYGYDKAGNPIRVTSPPGNRAIAGYDATGRLTSLIDPRGEVKGGKPAAFQWHLAWSKADRLLSVTSPGGRRSAVSYDLDGNLVSSTTPSGRVTTYAYDTANQLTSVALPGGAKTKYGYDANGNLRSVTGPRGAVTTRTLDGLGDPTAVKDPLGRITRFAYDADREIVKRTRPSGAVTSYGYDPDGNLTAIDEPGGTGDVTFSYDNANHLARMDDQTGFTQYRVDGVGQLQAYATSGAVPADNGEVQYGYDPAGNLTSLQYPDGASAAYTYDADGRMSTVRSSSGTVTYGYDAAGEPITVHRPNGVTDTTTYDADGLVTGTRAAKGSTVITSQKVAYTPDGDPATISTPQATTTYSYDARDRLVRACDGASCKQGDYSYGYDPAGNRVSTTINGVAAKYSYNAADELTSSTSGSKKTAYAYDANGDLTRAGTSTFGYDVESRLTTATVGGHKDTYLYDGLGHRIATTTPAGTTLSFWDERSPDGALLDQWSSGNFQTSRHVVEGLTPLTVEPLNGSPSQLHTDYLGSVDATSDPSGKPEWSFAYDPYGQSTSTKAATSAAQPIPLRYAGQVQDDTGLYDMRAREYSPATGSFTSVDPLSGGMSYGYADDNPLRYTDPSGEWPDNAPANPVGDAAVLAAETAPNAYSYWAGSEDLDRKNLILQAEAATLGYGQVKNGYVIWDVKIAAGENDFGWSTLIGWDDKGAPCDQIFESGHRLSWEPVTVIGTNDTGIYRVHLTP